MVPTHRVLAVDDNPRNLAIIEKALAGEYELVTAASGEEALELARFFRPDLILLDIMMPGIDGYETCRRMRATHCVESSKIIMISARATSSDRLEGYEAGANDYITKPFDPDELAAKVRVYLRLKSVEEVDRLKSDLLGLMSHETRTPLTTILSPAAMLLEDDTLSPDQREFVEMIQTGGRRLLAMFEKVAYLSQLKAGLVPWKLEHFETEGVVHRAVATALGKVNRSDVSVEIDVDSQIRIECDVEQMTFALEVLLHNAIRLSPPNGVVRVHVANAGPWSALSVSDEGPGIPPESLDRVFEEFFVENIQHHSTGHGLSLATARLITEQHGGSLLVESQPGLGATFQILLPAPKSAAAAA